MPPNKATVPPDIPGTKSAAPMSRPVKNVLHCINVFLTIAILIH